MISLQGKTNSFEKRVSDYAKAGVNVSASAKADGSNNNSTSKSL